MTIYTRRQFVQGAGAVGLGLLAGCGRLSWPGQQPTRMPRVGFLAARAIRTYEDAFRQGLLEYGYIEGQNILVEWRVAEDGAGGLSDLAVELVNLPVDVIVAQASPAAVAARQVTATIPVVTTLGDPVALGLAASLARPGRNVTGLTHLNSQLAAKRLELLKEAIPSLYRVAVLWTPDNQVKTAEWTETQNAARILSLQLQSLAISAPEHFEPAFAAAVQEQADGLVVFGDNLMASHIPRIVELAAKTRLPTMYESRPFIDAGGLLAYGPSFTDLYRRAAYFVDKILKGAKPADLPIEQPMLFDFIINLQTAQALGLTIPHHVLLQATEVIQ